MIDARLLTCSGRSCHIAQRSTTEQRREQYLGRHEAGAPAALPKACDNRSDADVSLLKRGNHGADEAQSDADIARHLLGDRDTAAEQQNVQ